MYKSLQWAFKTTADLSFYNSTEPIRQHGLQRAVDEVSTNPMRVIIVMMVHIFTLCNFMGIESLAK